MRNYLSHPFYNCISNVIVNTFGDHSFDSVNHKRANSRSASQPKSDLINQQITWIISPKTHSAEKVHIICQFIKLP